MPDLNKVIYQKDLAEDRLQDKPYARFNRTTDLTLSTTWQRVDFNGTSSLNANTYPNTGSGKQVDWDATDKKFVFNRDTLGLYNIFLTYQFAGGVRPASVDMRFVIPAPTPIYFPLPDTIEHLPLVDITRLATVATKDSQIVRSTSVVTEYGIGIELRTDVVGLLTKPDLAHCIIEIYPQ